MFLLASILFKNPFCTFDSIIPRVSYYNLDLSVCPSIRPSVPHLHGRLWTDRVQTWQEGQAPDCAEAKGIGFHGNQIVAMETWKCVL